jgi:hypothetical protein
MMCFVSANAKLQAAAAPSSNLQQTLTDSPPETHTLTGPDLHGFLADLPVIPHAKLAE